MTLSRLRAPDPEAVLEMFELAIEELTADHRGIARLPETDIGGDLGWMEPTPYLALSRPSMAEKVIRPLQQRGIDPFAPAITAQL